LSKLPQASPRGLRASLSRSLSRAVAQPHQAFNAVQLAAAIGFLDLPIQQGGGHVPLGFACGRVRLPLSQDLSWATAKDALSGRRSRGWGRRCWGPAHSPVPEPASAHVPRSGPSPGCAGRPAPRASTWWRGRTPSRPTAHSLCVARWWTVHPIGDAPGSGCGKSGRARVRRVARRVSAFGPSLRPRPQPHRHLGVLKEQGRVRDRQPQVDDQQHSRHLSRWGAQAIQGRPPPTGKPLPTRLALELLNPVHAASATTDQRVKRCIGVAIVITLGIRTGIARRAEGLALATRTLAFRPGQDAQLAYMSAQRCGMRVTTEGTIARCTRLERAWCWAFRWRDSRWDRWTSRLPETTRG